MPRWAAKVDGTHKEVTQALRAAGWTVVDTSRVGQDFPDLIAAKAGRTILVEVKARLGKLSVGQAAFLEQWPGEVLIARSAEEVLLLTSERSGHSQSQRGTG